MLICEKCEEFTVNKPENEGDPWTITAKYKKYYDDGEIREFIIDRMPINIIPHPELRHPLCHEHDIWRVNLGFGEIGVPGERLRFCERRYNQYDKNCR